MRVRTYTPAEVELIVRASETRLAVNGRATGHTGRQHILISNADLAARGDQFLRQANKDLPVACAFSDNASAFRAVAEALNSAVGQAALAHLDATMPTAQRPEVRAAVEAAVAPVPARYSSGADTVRKAQVPQAFVLLERIDDPPLHGLHVHTAYPVLWLRRGRPAWQDRDGAWH